MKRYFFSLMAGTLATTALVYGAVVAAVAGERMPLMVSFTDLKWTELPERKGMQFAILSGDSKLGQYTQLRKVPAGTDNPLTRTAVNSRT